MRCVSKTAFACRLVAIMAVGLWISPCLSSVRGWFRFLLVGLLLGKLQCRLRYWYQLVLSCVRGSSESLFRCPLLLVSGLWLLVLSFVVVSFVADRVWTYSVQLVIGSSVAACLVCYCLVGLFVSVAADAAVRLSLLVFIFTTFIHTSPSSSK
ncbi:hypothetical protein Tco_0131683 [Tanacetum coccineum]